MDERCLRLSAWIPRWAGTQGFTLRTASLRDALRSGLPQGPYVGLGEDLGCGVPG